MVLSKKSIVISSNEGDLSLLFEQDTVIDLVRLAEVSKKAQQFKLE